MRISDWSSDVCSSDLRQLKARLLPPPTEPTQREEVGAQIDDWSALTPLPFAPTAARPSGDDAIDGDADDSANAGIRREPELPAPEAIAPATPLPVHEFDALAHLLDDQALSAHTLQAQMR